MRLDRTESEAALLTAGHSQESLTRAFIHAIAGHVGLTCSFREFDYGIDLALHQVTVRTHPTTGRKRYVESGMHLDVQVKSTTNAVVRDGEVAYDLDVHAYDDLRIEKTCTPRILVLHVQPRAKHERLTVAREGLTVRGRCYWISLRGFREVPNKYRVRIQIPATHVLTEDTLKEVIRRVSTGEAL
jgi:hypothetical protein